MKKVVIAGPLAFLLIILVLIIFVVFLLPIAIITLAIILLSAVIMFFAGKFRKEKKKEDGFIDVDYAVKKE
ncbi:MAG: hypothetical protein V1702_05735 [Candidatus Woesearchaeota archaeon]